MRRLVLLLAVTACGRSEPVRLPSPSLSVSVTPLSIESSGQRTAVLISAQATTGQPGVGRVRLTSTAGNLANAGSQSLLLTNGQAGTEFFCDVGLDPGCSGSATLTAQWLNLTATAEVALVSSSADDGGILCIDGIGPPVDAGPLPRRCATRVSDECAGPVDGFLAGLGITRLNGSQGNGFDDDCDGQVDEGCRCPQTGMTKACFTVPASQASATGEPVGWCTQNARGTVDCDNTLRWSGVCRGGQIASRTDSCEPGDFDCDGIERNNVCRCSAAITCPTDPIQLAPYPDPRRLQVIDGNRWLADDTARAAAKNWQWVAVGGDCDNVLPNPTFALYAGADSQNSSRLGQRTRLAFDETATPPRLVEQPGAPVRGLVALTGNGVSGGRLAAAFGLSGDYQLQGTFELNRRIYSCTQKIEVRAPGLRAELCWESDTASRDIDLHFARLQGTTCRRNGWEQTCDQNQDCHYANDTPNWGYSPSPLPACDGWGTRGQPGLQCNNPRLDNDNVTCDPREPDPTSPTFCAPENINLDTPRDGDRFVVGANYFSGDAGSAVHANIYCNGERVASLGANPVTGAFFPRLVRPGGSSDGDLWMAAVITTQVRNGKLTCQVESVPARVPDPVRDGSANACVESKENTTFAYRTRAFVDEGSSQRAPAGSIPTNLADWCKH